MSKFAEPMSRLIDELKKLPGVGTKSAQRLAFYILRASDEDAEALAAVGAGHLAACHLPAGALAAARLPAGAPGASDR